MLWNMVIQSQGYKGLSIFFLILIFHMAEFRSESDHLFKVRVHSFFTYACRHSKPRIVHTAEFPQVEE